MKLSDERYSHISPTFTEQVNFVVHLNNEQVKDHIGDVKVIAKCFDLSLLKTGGNLRLDYKFCIEYFNEVNLGIASLLNLCREGVVVDIDYSEVKHGESLILELGKNIQRIRRIIEKNDLQENK